MSAHAFKRDVWLVYSMPFLAMALLTVLVLWRINAQDLITRRVEHSDNVLLVANNAEGDFREMQTAFRSYLVLHDSRYLDELRKARIAFEAKLETVAVAVTDNPEQVRGWVRVTRTYVPDKFEDLMKNVGHEPMEDIFTESSTYSSQVLDALNTFAAAEYRIRSQRIAHQRQIDRVIFLLVPIFSALIAIVLSYAGWREIGRAGERYARALARAEEANLAKDTFLATVSHELRNPLNSIMLLVAILLSDRQLHDEARQRVRSIDRAARSQAQLIEDLLDLSRIERGRLRLDVQATDIAQVVTAAVETLRVAAEAKSITLTDMIDTNIGAIAGDPKRLEQVVWNLVSNAIKFTPQGGKVQVCLERINSHVEIVVADNGQGIAASSLPYLFDRFWQETESAQRRTGVGLGLSIVKELVALHGGSVIAHSEGVGKGSTFIVRLPLPPAKAPLLEPRRHPTATAGASLASTSRLDGLTILVIDDQSESRDGLGALLGSLGAQVYADDSAMTALETVDRKSPDAIVCDIEMPVNDGFFFAHELRKLEQTKNTGLRTPLIALTAYGRVEDKVKILASGFDSHVVKPVDLAELSAIILSLVTTRLNLPHPGRERN